MSDTPEYVLERLVHHVLREEGAAARSLVAAALEMHAMPERFLAEVLFPAVECMHQLRHDGLISGRVFNAAARVLVRLTQQVEERLNASGDEAEEGEDGRPGEGEAGRRMLVLSAPGERTDLGAQVVAALAGERGFEVLFAGAHLSAEELLVACSRLQPEVLLVHGSLAASRPEAEALVQRLRRAGLWPGMQIAAAGTLAAQEGIGADISAADPMEVLELLALCPGYRAADQVTLRMLEGSSTFRGVDASVVRQFLSMFPPRVHGN